MTVMIAIRVWSMKMSPNWRILVGMWEAWQCSWMGQLLRELDEPFHWSRRTSSLKNQSTAKDTKDTRQQKSDGINSADSIRTTKEWEIEMQIGITKVIERPQYWGTQRRYYYYSQRRYYYSQRRVDWIRADSPIANKWQQEQMMHQSNNVLSVDVNYNNTWSKTEFK